jgi:hypothetical protein
MGKGTFLATSVRTVLSKMAVLRRDYLPKYASV